MSAADDRDERSAALMRALVAGQEGALADLVGLWQEPVLRFVYRYVQSESEAREIVHETFVRVHGEREKFQAARAFRPWLFTIAANLARQRRRWWHRHPSLAWLRPDAGDGPPAEPTCPAPTPEDALLQAERVQAVRAAVEALPHEWKVALLLHEYEELGYREIAEVLGCTERGVETRLTRARAALRKSLRAYLQAESHLVPAGAPQV